jgi:ribonucleoside-triphosphate reductase
MLSNLDNVGNGADGLLFSTGQRVFAEHLLTNILPKDVADSHLSGDLHITNPGIWSMIPDTIFVNVKELISLKMELFLEENTLMYQEYHHQNRLMI